MSFLGSLTGSDSISKAAKIQSRATQDAIRAQREAGDQAVGYYTPYREGGLSAWDKLMQITGLMGVEAQQRAYDDFRESPGVDFLRQQGIQAIDRSAAAAGSLKSGRTLADLDKFGQGLAEQSFGDYKGDLRYLNDMGYGVAGVSANARMGTASRIGDLTMDGARAQSELAMAKGQILPNLLSQVGAIGAGVYGKYLESQKPAPTYTSYRFGG